jgi:hypothetical protein
MNVSLLIYQYSRLNSIFTLFHSTAVQHKTRELLLQENGGDTNTDEPEPEPEKRQCLNHSKLLLTEEEFSVIQTIQGSDTSHNSNDDNNDGYIGDNNLGSDDHNDNLPAKLNEDDDEDLANSGDIFGSGSGNGVSTFIFHWHTFDNAHSN